MTTQRIFTVFVAVVLILTAGCGGSSTELTPADSNSQTQIGSTGYPAFPTGDQGGSPTRRVSDDEYSVMGSGYLLSHGGFNRAGDDDSYILISNVSQLAWAMYGISGITGDRPVSLALDVEAAELVAGDGQPQPVFYWVGIGDYTNQRWAFFGGYEASTLITINSEELRERYIDADGTLFFMVVVPPTNSSSEYYAVQVNTGTATSASGYLQNKPHFAAITEVTSGSGEPGHGASALSADQYVHLAWTHIAPFGTWDDQNAADTYSIYRRGPADTDKVLIGTIAAPAETYTDPLDNTESVPDPVPGQTYAYWLRAGNEAGSTLYSNCRQVAVPVLPPAGVAATDGDYTDRVVVSWEPADEATGYQVFRDDTAGDPVAEPGDTTSWEDTGVTAGMEYTYWVRTVYTGGVSDLSAGDTGYAGTLTVELDPPADVNATDGDHEDRVVLTWTKAADATGYQIFRDDTTGDPYATVGDVATWEDTTVFPGVTYTYWLRSAAEETTSELSASDTGYSFVAGFVVFKCIPTKCDPDTDYLGIFYEDPVIRRNPKITFDSGSGTLVPEDEEAYDDVLKTNGDEMQLHVATDIWPKVAVKQTANPLSISSISDGITGVFSFAPNPQRLSVDISVITIPGSPGDPEIYSFRVFNSDGTSPGGGTFTVSPTVPTREGPTGIDWGVNVWDREAGEIADRAYDNHSLNGNTVETVMPDVVWVEFSDGWYFDWPTEGDGVYAEYTGALNTNLLLRISETDDSNDMFCGLDPVIVGLGTEGAVICIWWPTRLAFVYGGMPGWPGMLDADETYNVGLEDPGTTGVDYTFSTQLSVIGTNPNY